MFGWSSILTESDQISREIAKTNLDINKSNLKSFKFCHVENGKYLPKQDERPEETSDESVPSRKVVVCNPPWFNGDGDHEKEAVGGEIKFVENILNEYTTDKRDDIHAFCFLIGQKRAHLEITKILKTKFQIKNCWKVKMDQGRISPILYFFTVCLGNYGTQNYLKII